MDYFTNWCLVCEKRIEHSGLYCSPKCLKVDFLVRGDDCSQQHQQQQQHHHIHSNPTSQQRLPFDSLHMPSSSQQHQQRGRAASATMAAYPSPPSSSTSTASNSSSAAAAAAAAYARSSSWSHPAATIPYNHTHINRPIEQSPDSFPLLLRRSKAMQRPAVSTGSFVDGGSDSVDPQVVIATASYHQTQHVYHAASAVGIFAPTTAETLGLLQRKGLK